MAKRVADKFLEWAAREYPFLEFAAEPIDYFDLGVAIRCTPPSGEVYRRATLYRDPSATYEFFRKIVAEIREAVANAEKTRPNVRAWANADLRRVKWLNG